MDKDFLKGNFLEQIREELFNDILPYWRSFAIDKNTMGFFGAIDNSNIPDLDKERTVVMVSRFLWTYSAAYSLSGNKEFLETADYAFKYLFSYFWDDKYGGFFWSVNADGNPAVCRKQIYGNAFALYALSEYSTALYKAEKRGITSSNRSTSILEDAWRLYCLLQANAKDLQNGGYYEAKNRDWSWTEETRLSEKDIDCCKSMNTNLHVMEAFSALCSALKDISEDDGRLYDVQRNLAELVNVHVENILQDDMHLALYFDREWNVLEPKEISFGHDIEASWLLWETVQSSGKFADESVKNKVLQIAQVSLEQGFDSVTGGMDNCIHSDDKRDSTRVWWVQAEAVNGFFNAWQLCKDERYMSAVKQLWNWINNFQKDKTWGEWFAEVSRDGKVDYGMPKGGNWKTCYHNGRMCMELLKRSCS